MPNQRKKTKKSIVVWMEIDFIAEVDAMVKDMGTDRSTKIVELLEKELIRYEREGAFPSDRVS